MQMLNAPGRTALREFLYLVATLKKRRRRTLSVVYRTRTGRDGALLVDIMPHK